MVVHIATLNQDGFYGFKEAQKVCIRPWRRTSLRQVKDTCAGRKVGAQAVSEGWDCRIEKRTNGGETLYDIFVDV